MGPGGPGAGGPGGFGGGQNVDPEERRRRMQERLASMTPEERAQFEARMKERGIDPNNPGAGRGGFGGPGTAGPGGPGAAAAPGAPRPQGAAGSAGQRGPVSSGLPGQGRPSGTAAVVPSQAGAQTIDQLFGPLPVTETSGRVWVHANAQIKAVRLRLGITDGTYTELLSGELKVGQDVVTAITTPAQAAASATRSPLMPQGRGGPGGFPGGGGGGRPGGGGR